MNTQANSRHFQIANGSAAIPFILLAMVFCLTHYFFPVGDGSIVA